MKLHKDPDAFSTIIERVNERTDIRMDILEKDYYVTLMLKELSDKQGTLPAYFKGGTALYKALGTIQRFSEDINLTVRVDDCPKAEARHRLEQASRNYQSLSRTAKLEDSEYDYGDAISSAYDYDPIVEYDYNDALQRFGHVRIEATSYTVSEPTEVKEISAVIYEYSTSEEKKVLESQYDVVPFLLKTIKAERIFIDKIFASEHYYVGQRYTDVAKHIYDIAVMCQLDFAKELLNNPEQLCEMIAYKRQEESGWEASAVADKPFSKFLLARGFEKNTELAKAYARMQDIYIFDDAYRIKYSAVCEAVVEILDTIVSRVEQCNPLEGSR